VLAGIGVGHARAWKRGLRATVDTAREELMQKLALRDSGPSSGSGPSSASDAVNVSGSRVT
jgi:hypothetical protein